MPSDQFSSKLFLAITFPNLIGMDVPSLKKTHPQKYYFKSICTLMYYLGLGDIWYEETIRSYYSKMFYTIWSAIANCYIFTVLLDEISSYFRSDLTNREKNDLFVFTIAHPLICCKILTLYISKDRIKIVMEQLLDGTRPVFSSMRLEKASVKQFTRHCLTLIFGSYVTLCSATVAGIKAHLAEDVPIRTEVVFFPKPSDTGIFINVLRFFVEFHWYYIVAMMATIDCLALCSLVMVGHKFRVLSLYFRNLRTKTLENKTKMGKREMEKEFKKDFIVGIKLHADALWCARNVQQSMGPLYSIQVLESVGLLVMCLMKLVSVERNFVYLLANLAFIVCMIVITGAYMMPGGDITYEASVVGTSIFHSGWEYCRPQSDLRSLAVVALQMSQVPVYMTAFGVITLSHTNFISVLRSSYSFFAVMY